MLEFLHIENVAVIKKLDIEFNNGFTVLTGETGAGKSIIIDSINLLLGAKASKEIIRHGESRAVVSAYFSSVGDSVYALCDELGIPYDREDTFSISRSYTIDGKNTVKINSSAATLSQLKALGVKLINIHGQNENHSFIDKSNHIHLLDEYANLDETIEKYSSLYAKLNTIKSEITKLTEANKQRDTMVDILNYQIKEIISAKLSDIDEEEKLLELRTKLKSSEKIVKNTSAVYKVLLQNDSGISAVVLIDKAIDALGRLTDVEPSASDLIEKLSSFRYEIEDIAETVHDMGSFDSSVEPEKQLDMVENRLALINRLEKKYGTTIKDVIEFKSNAEEKLKSFESAESRIEDLKHEYKVTYGEAMDIAKSLHEKREDYAKKLSVLVKDTLLFLDMPKVQFEIQVKECEKDGKRVLNSLGYDDVEFMVMTNAGEALASMSKIASGGELARIMLALKSALTDKNGAQTVIFDEIDTGVSGGTSQKIGIKLAQIAKSTQTLCVTHSAQIAALSQNHYFIKKNEIDGRAETSLELLDDDARMKEIARIIGGIDLTDKQYEAAKELLNQSKKLLK